MAKMLIVDDCEDNRAFCELIAHMFSIDVKLASTVDEAFEILGSGYVPGVILLDLVMPGRPPEELVAHIKATPSFSETKIVLTSALRELRVIAASMGADGALKKPYNMPDFVDSFRKYSLVAG
jgi:CheY-like chemotaxis protein